MALSNRDRVGRALEIMAAALLPFVDRHMAAALAWQGLAGRDDRPGPDGRSASHDGADRPSAAAAGDRREQPGVP